LLVFARLHCCLRRVQFSRYVDGGYAWDDVFMREFLPWNSGWSLDNVYSGLLVHLFRYVGGDSAAPATPLVPSPFPCDDPTLAALSCGAAFLRRVFRVAVPLLLAQGASRRPASKADTQTARDNFVLAASIAAGRSLEDHFTRELRWPALAERAQLLLVELLGIAAGVAPWPACFVPLQ
jgi:hypothetical protein